MPGVKGISINLRSPMMHLTTLTRIYFNVLLFIIAIIDKYRLKAMVAVASVTFALWVSGGFGDVLPHLATVV